jgi:hypothetical protein
MAMDMSRTRAFEVIVAAAEEWAVGVGNAEVVLAPLSLISVP